MKDLPSAKAASGKLWGTFLFSVAMAYVEAAAVVYLRRINGIDTFMVNPGLFDAQIAAIELGRELATMIMLFAVGWTAGRNFQSRFGFSIFCFGLWDIFYYVWLRVFVGWPATLLDKDLLFLIPLPWWGPVLSPLLIAALMSAVGARMVVLDSREESIHIRPIKWVALAGGILLMLYSFMADAISILPADAQTPSQMQPHPFGWLIFLPGFGLVIFAAWRILFGRKNPHT
jgi:hypothetical protein